MMADMRGAPGPAYYHHARPEVQALVPTTAQRILDVGCAAGVMGEVLKRRQACEVWGVEPVPAGAGEAQRRLDRVITGSIEDASVRAGLPDAAFDVVIFADVLEHLRDPEEVLRDLRRCLRPGACLVASVPNVRHWSVLKHLLEGGWEYQDAGILDRTHLRFFTGASLTAMLSRAGYALATVQGTMWRGCEVPRGLAAALRSFDIESGTLEEEGKIYQFLLVAHPAAPAAVCGDDLREGWAALRAAEWGGACEAFVRVLRRDRNDPQARSGLGLGLVALGDTEEGLAQLTEGARLSPTPDLASNLACGLIHVGRWDEAEGLLERILAESPGHGPAAQNLGRLRAARGHNGGPARPDAAAGAGTRTTSELR